MALEISEIAVRLAVGAPGGAPAAASGGRAAAGAAADGRPAGLAPQQYEDLVRACVQDVLASLRMSGER